MSFARYIPTYRVFSKEEIEKQDKDREIRKIAEAAEKERLDLMNAARKRKPKIKKVENVIPSKHIDTMQPLLVKSKKVVTPEQIEKMKQGAASKREQKRIALEKTVAKYAPEKAKAEAEVRARKARVEARDIKEKTDKKLEKAKNKTKREADKERNKIKREERKQNKEIKKAESKIKKNDRILKQIKTCDDRIKELKKRLT